MAVTIKKNLLYSATFFDSLNAELLHHLITLNKTKFCQVLKRYIDNYHIPLINQKQPSINTTLQIVQLHLLELGYKKFVHHEPPLCRYLEKKFKSNIIVNHKNFIIIYKELYTNTYPSERIL